MKRFPGLEFLGMELRKLDSECYNSGNREHPRVEIDKEFSLSCL